MKKRYWIPLALLALLAVTWLLGPAPPEPVFGTDLPEVPTTAAALESFIARGESQVELRTDNEARIVWADSSRRKTPVAFVYLHGFAGSYRDGYPWNVRLADTFNANIYLARYAGHGIKPPNSQVDFSPEAAWADAREALAIGEQLGEQVVLLSTSTGGTLATLLAAKFPDRVHGIINIGPNFEDDIPGAWLLNTNWGYELARLVSIDKFREVSYDNPAANQYWDTAFVSDALVELQVLVDAAVQDTVLNTLRCPVLTMYYYADAQHEDERVEVDVYPEVHGWFATPPEQIKLLPLPTPKTHFAGSEIMSEDTETPLREAVAFCRGQLGMR